jgi:hypothetical protein
MNLTPHLESKQLHMVFATFDQTSHDEQSQLVVFFVSALALQQDIQQE